MFFQLFTKNVYCSHKHNIETYIYSIVKEYEIIRNIFKAWAPTIFLSLLVRVLMVKKINIKKEEKLPHFNTSGLPTAI